MGEVPSGIEARLIAVEQTIGLHQGDLRYQRDAHQELKREHAVTRVHVEEQEKDLNALHERLDRTAKAFWAATGALMTVAVAVCGLIATILSAGGGS